MATEKPYLFGSTGYHVYEAESSASKWSCVVVDDHPGQYRKLLQKLTDEDEGLCSLALTLPFDDMSIRFLSGYSIQVDLAEEEEGKRVHRQKHIKLPNKTKCVLLLDMKNDTEQTFQGNKNSDNAGAYFSRAIRASFEGEVVIVSRYSQSEARGKFPELFWKPLVRREDGDGEQLLQGESRSDAQLSPKKINEIIEGIRALVEEHVALEDLTFEQWEQVVAAGRAFKKARHLPPKRGFPRDDTGRGYWKKWLEAEVGEANTLLSILKNSGFKELDRFHIPDQEERIIWEPSGIRPKLRDIACMRPNPDHPLNGRPDHPLRDYLEHCQKELEAKHSIALDFQLHECLPRYLSFNAVALGCLLDCMADSLKDKTCQKRIALDIAVWRDRARITISEPGLYLEDYEFEVWPESMKGTGGGSHMACSVHSVAILGATEIHIANRTQIRTVRIKDNGPPSLQEDESQREDSGFCMWFDVPYV